MLYLILKTLNKILKILLLPHKSVLNNQRLYSGKVACIFRRKFFSFYLKLIIDFFMVKCSLKNFIVFTVYQKYLNIDLNTYDFAHVEFKKQNMNRGEGGKKGKQNHET